MTLSMISVFYRNGIAWKLDHPRKMNESKVLIRLRCKPSWKNRPWTKGKKVLFTL